MTKEKEIHYTNVGERKNTNNEDKERKKECK